MIMKTTRALVLVIDDNDDEVFITRTVLSRIDPEISTAIATSGEQGLEFLRKSETPPSLILLDLKMPGMGGIDFLRFIRADNRLHSLPVIVVTNSTLEADERESLEAGASSFLRKASTIDQFQEDIAASLGKWLKNNKPRP